VDSHRPPFKQLQRSLALGAMMFTAARTSVLAVASVLLLQPASSSHEVQQMAVTPIQKVIDMLGSMMANAQKEKHVEEVEFAKYQEWCDNTRKVKTQSIAEGTENIKSLAADIAKAQSDAELLAEEIAGLEADIASDKAEAESATTVRDKEHTDYIAQHKDFSESIDACARAIQVLKSREHDVPQSLLQLQKSALVPAESKAMIESLLAMKGQEEMATDAGAPEANAYEFQSGSVVTMLEKLKRKFQEQLLVLEKEEMHAKGNYEVLMQQLTDNMKYATTSAADKTAAKAGRLADAATAKGEKATAEEVKADDEKTLGDTLAECTASSAEYERNQVVRAEEIKAIKKATDILQSNAVSGSADKYLPAAALTQIRATAFAHLRSMSTDDSQARQRVVDFLQKRAAALSSRYLSLVAARALEDPMAKVKKMIKDLIVKLMEQANTEADHNAYCTTELATNKLTRENKNAAIEDLTAKVDELTALSQKLATDIQELSDGIAELRQEQAEATRIRGEEKTVNAQTVSDAKEGQQAVEAAIKILKEFYSKASDSALLQGSGGLSQAMAQAASVPYKGMQGESTGVLGMLDVILSDFSRLEAETSSAEDQAVSAYDKFMAESTQSIAIKNTESKHKEHKKQQTDDKNRSLTKERGLTQGELDAALDYYEKLKADCVDTNLSYEARVQAREQEIQSLKEAMRILAGEDLA